ncbi:MAG: hypothetical protein H6867_03625 [Rhodospirillales bacterium]|nr:hypothetical protein [Rhodospirillales bacterium]MCB9996241.1 hypothetical protein [Rhodospirillales bacterium]
MTLSQTLKRAAEAVPYEQHEAQWLTNIDAAKIRQAQGGYVVIESAGSPEGTRLVEGVIGAPNPNTSGNIGIFELDPR